MKFRNRCLAGAWLAGLTLTSLLGLPQVSYGQEIYLNENCQRITPNISAGFPDGFLVFYRRNLTVAGQTYWFSSGRYQDGAAIACLSRANYQQGKRLPFAELQTQFIRSIKAETSENTTFRIVVAQGNGRRVPLIEYRLNLTNPARPTLAKLRSWVE